MNENIDLTKILKNCPKGTMFYSTIYGYVYFDKIKKDSSYPIIFETSQGNKIDTTANGKNCEHFDGECTLFPSKDQRDWSKFTAPWLEKQGDSLRVNDRAWLYLVSDVLTWKYGIGQYLDDPRVQEIAKRLCDKYAQKLYNPSVISNSSNTGKSEQKFDPKTLKAFDRVLVSDVDGDIWHCNIFEYIRECAYPYSCVYSAWERCIPYNDETKHLVGTTEEAPEYYRYWED